MADESATITPPASQAAAQEPSSQDAASLLEQAAQEASANLGQKPTETPSGDKADGADTEQRIELPEGWRDTEDAKGLRAEGYQEAQGHFEKKHQRDLRERETRFEQEKQQAARVAEAAAGVSRVGEGVEKWLQDQADPEEAQKWLTRTLKENEVWALAFNQHLEQVGQQHGFYDALGQVRSVLVKSSGVGKEIVEQLEDFDEELRLEEAKNGGTVAQAVPKLLSKLIELVRQDEAAKLEKLSKERLAEEAKAKQREEKKPAVDTTGRGGDGKSYDMTTVSGVMAAKRAGQLSEDQASRRLREITS